MDDGTCDSGEDHCLECVPRAVAPPCPSRIAFQVAVGLLALFPFASGCGPTYSGPPLVPVEGTVTLDGKPLADATVTFIPTGATMGQSSFGSTDTEGHFVLKTAEGHAGAPAGRYKVVISKWLNPDGTVFRPSPDVSPMDSTAKESISPAYSEADRTQLEATVAAAAAPQQFTLTSTAR
jgi:hypothetical protein